MVRLLARGPFALSIAGALAWVAACGAPATVPAEASQPSRVLPHGTGASIDSVDVHHASLTLEKVLCQSGEDASANLHPGARVVEGFCAGKTFAYFLDEQGRLGEPQPPGLGIPGINIDDDDYFEASLLVGGAPWIVARDLTSAGRIQTVVYGREAAQWLPRFNSDRGGPSANTQVEVLGLGEWPGGALMMTTDGTDQRLDVIAGSPRLPLPTLPDRRQCRLVQLVSVASGLAVAVGRLSNPPSKGTSIYRWRAGRAAAEIQTWPDLDVVESAPRRQLLAVRSESEILFPVEENNAPVATRPTIIMRFDGTRLVRSATLDGVRPQTFEWARDGALWAIMSRDGDSEQPDLLWRRRPGRDEWDVFDESLLSPEIDPVGIVAAGEHDLMLLGALRNQGWGLYRLHLPPPPPAPPPPPRDRREDEP